MDLVTLAQQVLQRAEDGWNAADGGIYAEPFAPDATFVDIRGELHTGAEAIARGHQRLFDTIYKDSTVRYEVVRARSLDDRVILAHIRATLAIPHGRYAGKHRALASAVLVAGDGGHRVAAFHNTLVFADPIGAKQLA